jgi:hypothetical protein
VIVAAVAEAFGASHRARAAFQPPSSGCPDDERPTSPSGGLLSWRHGRARVVIGGSRRRGARALLPRELRTGRDRPGADRSRAGHERGCSDRGGGSRARSDRAAFRAARRGVRACVAAADASATRAGADELAVRDPLQRRWRGRRCRDGRPAPGCAGRAARGTRGPWPVRARAARRVAGAGRGPDRGRARGPRGRVMVLSGRAR